MNACLTCGSPVGEEARFCPHCGQSMSAPPAPPDAPGPAAREGWPAGAALQAWRFVPGAGKDEMPHRHHFEMHGRGGEVERITSALRANQRVVVWGACGVGKSAVAGECARRSVDPKQFPDGLLFIDGVYTATVHALCDAIAMHLNNLEIPKLPPAEKPAAVRQFLHGKELLLVLDELESPQVAETLIGSCLPKFMPLLATSLQKLPGFDADFEIRPLDAAAAASLFAARARVPESDARVGAVCDLLGYRPLALLFAADLVGGDAERLTALSEQITAVKSELRGRAGHASADTNAWAVLDLIYRRLEEGERLVFTRAAATSGESVGMKLLAKLCGLPHAECRAHAQALASRNLILKQNNRVSMHSMLREFGRAVIGDWLEAVWDGYLSVLIGYAARHAEKTVENYSTLEAEMGQLLWAVQYASRRRRWAEVLTLVGHLQDTLDVRGHWTNLILLYEAACVAAEQTGDTRAQLRLSFSAARTYSKQGNYAQARRLFETVLTLGERLDERGEVASALHYLGRLAREQQQHNEARRYFQRSMAVYQELHDEEGRAGMARNLQQLGVIEQAEGRYHESERLYRQALEERQAIRANSLEEGEILNNLGLLEQAKGGEASYKKALKLYSEALNVYKKVSGKNYAEYAGTLNNLARLHYVMGDYQKAGRLYHDALDIRAEYLGAHHPDVAQSLNNLAGLDYTMGNYDSATQRLEEAIRIYRMSLGENNPRFATCLNNLAGIYHATGKFDEAERLYRRALALYTETLGEGHPELAQILNNIGLLYQSLGDYSQAEGYFQRALGIRATQGADHPGYAQIQNNLGLLYEAQGRHDKAESFIREALDTRRRILGSAHPDIAQSLVNLAELHQKQGDYKAADPLLREALAIYRQTLGHDHFCVDKALEDLAILNDALGRADEAEGFYKEALEIQRRINKGDSLRYAALLTSLAELSQNRGKYAEAEELYRRILEVYSQRLGETHAFIAQTYISLGELAMKQQAPERAISYFRAALAVAEKLSDHPGVANIRFQLGQVYQRQNKPDEAEASYAASLEVSQALNDEAGIARTEHHLGALLMEQGRDDAAASHFERSLTLNRKLGIKNGEAGNLLQLALIAERRGDPDSSSRLAQESREIRSNLSAIASLRSTLLEKLNEEEVASLISSFDLNEVLPGRGLSAQVNELLALVYRRNLVEKLQETIRQLYPNKEL